MALQKNRVVNSNRSWDAGRVYKVNEVVQIAGVVYQNLTGGNSDPTLLVDWVVVYQDVGVIYTQAEVDALLADKIDKNATGWASYVDTQKTVGVPLNLVAGVDTPLRIRANTIIDFQIPEGVKAFYVSGRLVVTSVTGVFVEGETITGGTSGATAVIKEIYSTTEFGIVNYIGNFTGTETITGGTSGATSSFSSLGNGYVTGRNGDSIDIMLYFKAVPSAINSEIDIWINIGGAVGELYRQTILFRGTTEKGAMYTIPSGYTLGTWEANGGVIYLKSSVNMQVYGVTLNLDRSHKAI